MSCTASRSGSGVEVSLRAMGAGWSQEREDEENEMMDWGRGRWDKLGSLGRVRHNLAKVPRQVFSVCVGCLARLRAGAIGLESVVPG